MKKRVMGIFPILAGIVFGAGMVGNLKKTIKKTEKKSKKHLSLFLMMNQWVKVKQEGKNLSEYLEKNGYKKIAVYGMSYAGERLLQELQDSDVTVVYGIDQKAGSIFTDVDIVSLEDELESVDAVVVTAITFFDEIEEELVKKLDCPILSLEDILYEC